MLRMGLMVRELDSGLWVGQGVSQERGRWALGVGGHKGAGGSQPFPNRALLPAAAGPLLPSGRQGEAQPALVRSTAGRLWMSSPAASSPPGRQATPTVTGRALIPCTSDHASVHSFTL